jgi:hypothetical protein
MNVLPDHARDWHRSHEAHNDDALAFHSRENGERPTSNELNSALGVGC